MSPTRQPASNDAPSAEGLVTPPKASGHISSPPLPSGLPHENARHERVPSEHLFKGSRLLEIEHQGEVYRLQLTRQGKLILTK